MNYRCLSDDLGFPKGTILPGATFDASTAKQFSGWGLIEETDDISSEAAIASPTDSQGLTDEELARLTDPASTDDTNNY